MGCLVPFDAHPEPQSSHMLHPFPINSSSVCPGLVVTSGLSLGPFDKRCRRVLLLPVQRSLLPPHGDGEVVEMLRAMSWEAEGA